MYYAFTEDDDSFDVITELTPLAARWRAIGRALRLKSEKLEYPENPDQCLSEVIEEWLSKRNYNQEKFGPPTWKWVVDVVAARAGGDNKGLADEIAKKYLSSKQEGMSANETSKHGKEWKPFCFTL